MAARYWVGGNATWDSTAGSKWALTSGGAGGQAVPTASDDVYLDNGTGHGNVTIATGYTAVCKSITCTGYVGTLSSASATGNLTVSGNVTFVSGMTLSITGVITINATSTLTTGGKSLDNLTVSGSGITVTLGSALTVTNTLTLTQGTLTTSGSNYALNCAAFSSSGSSARTLNLNASTMTISGTGTAWTTATSTSFTLSGTGSTITFSYSGSSAMTISAGAALNVGGSTGSILFTGGTYNLTKPTNFDTSGTLDFTGYAGALQQAISTAAKTLTLSSGLTQYTGNSVTLTGSGGCTLTCAGKSITTFTISSLTGTLTFADTPGFTGALSRAINMALATGVSATFQTLTCTSLNFGTGGSLTLTGSGTIFSGGMTGTGSLTSNYTGSSSRTISSGGTSGVDFYLQNGSGTFTLGNGSATLFCNNFYSTGFTGTFYLPGQPFYAYGATVDLTGAATYTTAAAGTEYLYLQNATVTSFSAPIGSGFGWYGVNANAASQSVTMSGNVDLGAKALNFTPSSNGTLNMNGYNFTGALTFSYTGSLNLGSGSHTFKYVDSTNVGLVMTYGGSITGGTSTVTFDGSASKVYFQVQNSPSNLYAPTGSFYNLVFKGRVEFDVGTVTANALSVTLAAGTNSFTQTLYASTYWFIGGYLTFAPSLTLTSLTLAGNATYQYTLNGVNSSYPHSKFVVSSGTILCDYLTINGYDASGGATFWAGANSTINNSAAGWNAGVPSKGSFLSRLGLW